MFFIFSAMPIKLNLCLFFCPKDNGCAVYGVMPPICTLLPLLRRRRLCRKVISCRPCQIIVIAINFYAAPFRRRTFIVDIFQPAATIERIASDQGHTATDRHTFKPAATIERIRGNRFDGFTEMSQSSNLCIPQKSDSRTSLHMYNFPHSK